MISTPTIRFSPSSSKLLSCKIVDTDDLLLAAIARSKKKNKKNKQKTAKKTKKGTIYNKCDWKSLPSQTKSTIQHQHDMIDAAFLFASAPHLLRSMAGSPQPDLRVQVGKQSSDRVVGQLMRPLVIAVQSQTTGEIASNLSSCSTVALHNLLVVQDLPVPLYLLSSTMRQIAKSSGHPTQILRRKWSRDDFPAQYHNHPYWRTHRVPHDTLSVTRTCHSPCSVIGLESHGEMASPPSSSRPRWKRRMSI